MFSHSKFNNLHNNLVSLSIKSGNVKIVFQAVFKPFVTTTDSAAYFIQRVNKQKLISHDSTNILMKLLQNLFPADTADTR